MCRNVKKKGCVEMSKRSMPGNVKDFAQVQDRSYLYYNHYDLVYFVLTFQLIKVF